MDMHIHTYIHVGIVAPSLLAPFFGRPCDCVEVTLDESVPGSVLDCQRAASYLWVRDRNEKYTE